MIGVKYQLDRLKEQVDRKYVNTSIDHKVYNDTIYMWVYICNVVDDNVSMPLRLSVRKESM